MNEDNRTGLFGEVLHKSGASFIISVLVSTDNSRVDQRKSITLRTCVVDSTLDGIRVPRQIVDCYAF